MVESGRPVGAGWKLSERRTNTLAAAGQGRVTTSEMPGKPQPPAIHIHDAESDTLPTEHGAAVIKVGLALTCIR